MTQPINARSAVCAVLAIAAFAGGCSNTRPSDPPAPPLANECGGGQHISSVLSSVIDGVVTPGFYGPAPWVQPSNQTSTNCPYPAPFSIYSTCLTVTAVDNFDETGDGAVGSVYVQDNVSPIPQFAGATMFDPSFTPPDLRVQPGNVLDFTGTYEEYAGPSTFIFPECQTLPQLEGSAVFRFDGTVPTPVAIMPGDLSTFDGAREFENMLVKVSNVSIAAAGSSSSGRYCASVTVPNGQEWTICNELFDLGGECSLSTVNQTFASVTGIVTYFGGYQLAPRSCCDFELVGGGTLCSGPPDAGSPDGG